MIDQFNILREAYPPCVEPVVFPGKSYSLCLMLLGKCKTGFHVEKAEVKRMGFFFLFFYFYMTTDEKIMMCQKYVTSS